MSVNDDRAVPRAYDRFCCWWAGLCSGVSTGYFVATFVHGEPFPWEVIVAGNALLVLSTLPAIGSAIFRYRHARRAAERKLRAELQIELDLVRARQVPTNAPEAKS